MKTSLKKSQIQFSCPFCKRVIANAKKTEIYYRSQWVYGCSKCFADSISKTSNVSFQEKEY